MSQKILTLHDVLEAWVDGIAENILAPISILLFAWTLGQVVTDLQVLAYKAHTLGENLSAASLPALVT